MNPVIPILSAANFVIGMGAFMVIGFLIPLADDMGVSPGRAGWLMTTYALSYAVLSPVLVAVTGRIGRRRVLAAGFAAFALGNILSALAPGEGLLHLSRIIAAAGAGITTPVAAAVAAATVAPAGRGKALSAVFLGLTLAQVLGVPVGGYVAFTFGWRAAFWLVGLLAVPFLWLIWTKVPRGLALPPVALSDLGRALVSGRVMARVLFISSFLGSLYVVYTYLTPLLTTTMGFGRDGVTLALLIYGGGAVVGNLVGGALTDRIGPFRTLSVLVVAQICLLPLLSLLPVPVWALFPLLVVWSIFGWSIMAPQQTRLIVLDPSNASVLLALSAAGSYIGAAVGSAVGSVVLDRFGVQALGIAGCLCMVGAGAHLWATRSDPRGDPSG